MDFDRAKDYHDNKYREPQVSTDNEPPEDAAMDRFTDPETADAVDLYGTLCASVPEDGFDMEALDVGLNKDWTIVHCSLPNGFDIDQASNWIMEKSQRMANNEELTAAFMPHLELPLRTDGSEYKPESLNDDQKQVFYCVMSFLKDWIEQKRMLPTSNTQNGMQFEKQFLLTVAGEGGSGKSTLVKTLVSVIRQIFQENNTAMVAAPTGSASFNGGGVTMHRLFGLGVNNNNSNIGAEKEQRLKKTFRNVILQVFDERSMISAENLGMVDKHAKKIVHHGTNAVMPFGGIPIVLMVGDDFQLPPVTPGVTGSLSNNNQNDYDVEDDSKEVQDETRKRKRKEVGVKVQNAGKCAMTRIGQELFKLMGRKYIKLKTCERVLKDQQVLTTCLKGVRGDCTKSISEQNI